jgi:hypothetical protein
VEEEEALFEVGDTFYDVALKCTWVIRDVHIDADNKRKIVCVASGVTRIADAEWFIDMLAIGKWVGSPIIRLNAGDKLLDGIDHGFTVTKVDLPGKRIELVTDSGVLNTWGLTDAKDLIRRKLWKPLKPMSWENLQSS